MVARACGYSGHDGVWLQRLWVTWALGNKAFGCKGLRLEGRYVTRALGCKRVTKAHWLRGNLSAKAFGYKSVWDKGVWFEAV